MLEIRFDLIDKMSASKNRIDEFLGHSLFEAHFKYDIDGDKSWQTWKWINRVFKDKIAKYK